MGIKSQTRAIAAWLREGNSITPIVALKLCGCLRLSARIFDLKEKGMAIRTEMVQDGTKRYARYSLIRKEE